LKKILLGFFIPMLLLGCSNTFIGHMSVPYWSKQTPLESDSPVDLRDIEYILKNEDLIVFPVLNDNFHMISGSQNILGIPIEEFRPYTNAPAQSFQLVLGFKVQSEQVVFYPYSVQLHIHDRNFSPNKVSSIRKRSTCLGTQLDIEAELEKSEEVVLYSLYENSEKSLNSWQCFRFTYTVPPPRADESFQIELSYLKHIPTRQTINFVPTLVLQRQTH
jgi:hypothetical protein